MKTITIKNYSDLQEIKNTDKEIEIVFDENCTISIRKRVIDFLSGLAYQHGTLKKKDNKTFVINIAN